MRASCEYRYVPFERQCPCTYSYWYTSTRYLVCHYRASSTSSIHSSSSSNIRNIWSSCGIRSIALPYVQSTSRRVLVLQHWFLHTSVCGRETLPVSCDTRIRSYVHVARILRVRTVPYTVHYIVYGTTAVLAPKYARFLQI